MNNPEGLRAYNAGTVTIGDSIVLAVRDNTGKVWIELQGFLRKSQAWLMSSPALWRIPECPSAVVVCEGGELDFAGAEELAALVQRPLGCFELSPDPAARRVHRN